MGPDRKVSARFRNSKKVGTARLWLARVRWQCHVDGETVCMCLSGAAHWGLTIPGEDSNEMEATDIPWFLLLEYPSMSRMGSRETEKISETKWASHGGLGEGESIKLIREGQFPARYNTICS